jgi:hypothetical protein
VYLTLSALLVLAAFALLRGPAGNWRRTSSIPPS